MLLLLGYYTWLYFFSIPTLGFNISSDGTVYNLFLEISDIELNDQILMIGKNNWGDLKDDLSKPLFEDYSSGGVIPITVLDTKGTTKQLEVIWQPLTLENFLEFKTTQWLFGYFFWLGGTLVVLMIRPQDRRWKLLIAFLFLFGLWLTTGSGPSFYHLGYAGYVMRVVSWLLLPIMLHLHWDFPHPFKNPKWFRKASLMIVYPIAIFMSVYQFSNPGLYKSYSIALSIGLMGSILLLLAHFFLQKAHRNDTKVLIYLSITAFIPLALIGYLFARGITPPLSGLSILGLPLIPTAYFYAIARGKLGTYEIRTNRIIGTYLYILFLFILLLLATAVLNGNQQIVVNNFSALLIGGAISAILTVLTYQPFITFVDKKVLGIPYPPESALHIYSQKIISSTDPLHLSDILENQILKSMQIVESALLDNTSSDQESAGWLYSHQTSPPAVPVDIYNHFHPLNGKYITPQLAEQLPDGFNWVKLILRLTHNDQLLGLWFLGRKDPDNYYSQQEINMLQTLANQTAVSLLNYRQAQSIRAIYNVNVQRHEIERESLSRDLHDETLNRLATLKRQSDDPEIQAGIESIIENLREIIHGLRPEMLNYGLLTALQDLSDHLSSRQDRVQIMVDLEGDLSPLADSIVELQVFRIVQQACDNALAQESCTLIHISGNITQNMIDITIQDDGPGLDINPVLTLNELLENKHFGLAGMYERAAIIQANLDIRSKPGEGVTLHLVWPAS